MKCWTRAELVLNCNPENSSGSRLCFRCLRNAFELHYENPSQDCDYQACQEATAYEETYDGGRNDNESCFDSESECEHDHRHVDHQPQDYAKYETEATKRDYPRENAHPERVEIWPVKEQVGI